MPVVAKTTIQAVLSCGTLLVVAAIVAAMLALTIEEYVDAKESQKTVEVTPKVADYIIALKNEFSLRKASGSTPEVVSTVLTPEVTTGQPATAAQLEAATERSSVAAANLFAEWKKLSLDDPNAGGQSLWVRDLESAFTAFRTDPTSFANYQVAVSRVLQALYHVSLNAVDGRFVAITSFLQSHYVILGSQLPALGHVALLNKIGEFTGTHSVVALSKALHVNEVLKYRLNPQLTELQAEVDALIRPVASQLQPKVTPTTINVGESTVTNVVQEFKFLSEELDSEIFYSLGARLPSGPLSDRIIVLSIGVVIMLLTAGTNLFVILRNARFTKRWSALVQEFDDQKTTSALQSAFKPLIKDMLVNTSPPPATSDLEEPFHDAAKLIRVLRPHVPQTLFGEFNTPAAGKSGEGATTGSAASPTSGELAQTGGWSISGEAARLDTGSAVVECTVMLVAASPPSSISRTDPSAMQRFYDHLMTLVTEEVNSRGGQIHTVSPSCHITAVWNACHPVVKPAQLALETTEAIQAGILLGSELDINVCSGPCLMSNTKAGEGKHVIFFGYPFDLGEKIMALNRIHDVVVVIDSNTYDALGRRQQLLCKPIAVFHENSDAVVVMSYNDDDILKGERWKAYNTAFTMYLNGFLDEALEAFETYLASYPSDRCAKWILEGILLPYRHDHLNRTAASSTA